MSDSDEAIESLSFIESDVADVIPLSNVLAPNFPAIALISHQPGPFHCGAPDG